MNEVSIKYLLYADDKLILASSACELQEMVTIMNDSIKKRGESLSNTVIEITDESFENRRQINTKIKSSRDSQKRLNTKQNKVNRFLNGDQTTNKGNNDGKLGDCPICWEELGRNELASTKCGHVFCYKCLKEWINTNCRRYCPTCRKELFGKTAFHRLYLSA